VGCDLGHETFIKPQALIIACALGALTTIAERANLDVSFHPGLEQLMGMSQRIAAMVAIVTLPGAMASCSGLTPGNQGPAGQAPAASGPAVTLRIDVYGSPGYRQAGLFAGYERLHPGVRIAEDSTAQEAGYWQALQRHLATGHGLGDLVAIPMAEMSDVLHRYRHSVVPLTTLGGVAGGVNTFEDQWLPWVWQPASRSGQAYAIGAETGPLGLCYRPRLLQEAGLPSSPAQLARDWSTWPGYLAFGRKFRQRIPKGPAFMDSVTSVYNAMVSQAGTQYYGPAAQLALPGNRAVKHAWDSAVTAARAGLSARLTPLSRAWDAGVTRLSFATTVCPAWLLSSIARLSGADGTGTWAVTGVPGGTGNWGGFYLAIPRASTHQQAAYQLAAYLTGQQAGPALAQAGAFPASSPAINAVTALTSSYFSGSPVGRIFSLADDRMPAAPTGPASAAIGAALDGALSQTEAGRLPPSHAWVVAIRRAIAASRAQPAPG
jgi:cellobiose transport system substrate-binding protein